jgi:hypothetical protein
MFCLPLFPGPSLVPTTITTSEQIEHKIFLYGCRSSVQEQNDIKDSERRNDDNESNRNLQARWGSLLCCNANQHNHLPDIRHVNNFSSFSDEQNKELIPKNCFEIKHSLMRRVYEE